MACGCSWYSHEPHTFGILHLLFANIQIDGRNKVLRAQLYLETGLPLAGIGLRQGNRFKHA